MTALIFLIVIHVLFARIIFKADFNSCLIFYFIILVGHNIVLSLVFISQHINNQEYIYGQIYILMIFNSTAYIYIHLHKMSETSARVKILFLIYSKMVCKKEQLCGVYTDKTLINHGLNRLIKFKQIENIKGFYKLKSSVLLRIPHIF